MGFAPGGRPREKIGGRQDTPPAEPCAPHGGVAWGPPAAHGQWRARAGQARAQRAATLRVGGVPGHGVGPGGLACRARPRAVVARLRTGSAPRRRCGRALRGPAAGLGGLVAPRRPSSAPRATRAAGVRMGELCGARRRPGGARRGRWAARRRRRGGQGWKGWGGVAALGLVAARCDGAATMAVYWRRRVCRGRAYCRGSASLRVVAVAVADALSGKRARRAAVGRVARQQRRGQRLRCRDAGQRRQRRRTLCGRGADGRCRKHGAGLLRACGPNVNSRYAAELLCHAEPRSRPMSRRPHSGPTSSWPCGDARGALSAAAAAGGSTGALRAGPGGFAGTTGDSMSLSTFGGELADELAPAAAQQSCARGVGRGAGRHSGPHGPGRPHVRRGHGDLLE